MGVFDVGRETGAAGRRRGLRRIGSGPESNRTGAGLDCARSRSPTLNGIEAARRIRKLSYQSKILFLSQESSADVAREAFRLGALGYVVKTRAGTELLSAVEAVLQAKQFVSRGLRCYEFPERPDVQSPNRHEIFFCSDDKALVDSFTRVIAAALNTGNAAIVSATASHRDSVLQK
jgi:DNA-binding NarL/FixJ family response regulator